MVVIHPQVPGPSYASSSQQVNKPKSRPSYRKSTEKYSTLAGPVSRRAGLANSRNSQKLRSLSVCSDAQLLQNGRRPPTLATNNFHRLSIADRFMSPSLPTNTTSTNDKPEHDKVIQSPTMTTKSLEFPSDGPTVSSNTGRLSVAERFMNTESTPSDSSLNDHIQQYRKRSMSSFSGKTVQATVFSSFSPEQTSGKLTIAETFMKVEKPINEEPEYDTKISEYETAHPLDITNASPFSDPVDIQLEFPIDLNTCFDTGKKKRPWGSQDTLVYQQTTEKKKPGYGQYTSYSDNRSVLSNDYHAASEYRTRHSTASCDDTSANIEPENIDYTDVEMGYKKSSETCYNTKQNVEKEEEIKKPSVQLKKITPAVPYQKSRQVESVPGFWLGCCFISCRRPDSSYSGKIIDSNKESRPRKSGCGKKAWVICIFLFLVILSVVVYFVWPITPLMRIENASLSSPPKITQRTQGFMVGNVAFESDWMVNVTVDNRRNHIPTRIVKIQVVAKDALTGLVIGKGTHNDDVDSETIILSPNSISTIQLPIHVDYQARDSIDTTFSHLVNSCSPRHNLSTNVLPTGQRKSLPLNFWITLHFFGLDLVGHKSSVVAIPATGGFVCPQ